MRWLHAGPWTAGCALCKPFQTKDIQACHLRFPVQIRLRGFTIPDNMIVADEEGTGCCGYSDKGADRRGNDREATSMKRYRKYLITVGLVALWAVFSYAHLGVEDGSSGLSPLGWLAAVFFVPGGLLFQAVKGSHANADLPLMAAFGFCVYAVVAVLTVKGGKCVGKFIFGR